MKKILLTLLFFGTTLISNSQNASVEKSINGVQIGLGTWVYNETKLSNQFALRTELGLDLGFYIQNNNNSNFLLAPVITLEPRWYYNLDKRVSKKRNISNNSGNFLSLKTSYHPDWFVISNTDNVRVTNQISIIPTWGIRRNLGKKFNYETGIGLGYVRYFKTENVFLQRKGEAVINLHLRIGYQF